MISAFFGKSWLLLASLGVVRLIKDHLTTDPSAVANKANEENLKQNIAHVSSANEDPHKLISTIRYTGNELKEPIMPTGVRCFSGALYASKL